MFKKKVVTIKIVKLFIVGHLPLKRLKKGFCSGTSNPHNILDFQPILMIFFANGHKNIAFEACDEKNTNLKRKKNHECPPFKPLCTPDLSYSHVNPSGLFLYVKKKLC